MNQQEQHSLTSLGARLGVSRATALGAVLSGRLGAKSTDVGARRIYSVSTDAVEKYRSDLLAKLKARVAKVTTDPIRSREMLSSALAAVRDEAMKENEVMTPPPLADLLGISLESASYLLGRYGERIENGFRVSDSAMQKIRRHVDETRGSGTIQNKGGVFVP